jgi:hypothetical protein
VIAQDADFEAAAAEVRDATKRRFGTEGGENRFPAKSRFFGRADDFKPKFGFLADAPNESVAILRFTRGAGGNGAVTSDSELLHHFLKMRKGLDASFEDFFAEAVADEDTFAKAQRISFIVKWFEVDGGMRAHDGKAYGVGTGINRGDVNRL